MHIHIRCVCTNKLEQLETKSLRRDLYYIFDFVFVLFDSYIDPRVLTLTHIYIYILGVNIIEYPFLSFFTIGSGDESHNGKS